jgi:hypothetical protein
MLTIDSPGQESPVSYSKIPVAIFSHVLYSRHTQPGITMKLSTSAEDAVQVSSEELMTGSFGIGDPGVIIRHLTKTLYSNPIQSIVREIMSNGRDSHIETKKTNVPIRVKIPTRNSPTWEVRDWGPGIDPTRFKDIYTQFGNSTKRGNNKESGGFGVGAKTPWAYTDTFTVTTVAWEGKQLVKRVRACVSANLSSIEIAPKVVIDPSDTTLEAEDRGTGTTISVTIKPDDIQRFAEETVAMSEFWKVRPELYGRDPLPEYRNYTNSYEGKTWRIIHSKNWQWNNQSFVCIDGIPYPFNYNSFSAAAAGARAQDVDHLLRNFSFVWDCNVGELDLSLNREQLMYTDRTCEALMARIEIIMTELKTQLEENIKDAKNLWEAHVQWSSIHSMFRYGCPIKNVAWNGHSLEKNNICVTTNQNTGAKLYTYLRKDRKGELSLRCHQGYNFSAASDSKLVFCDEEKIDLSKVRRIIMEDPKINEVHVVKPNNVGADGGAYVADPAWQTIKTAIHFDLLNPTMLSTIAKIDRVKVVKDANGVAIPKKKTVQAYLYEEYKRSSETVQRFQDKEADLKDGSGVYVEVFRGEFAHSDDKILTRALHHIDPSIDIYGIPQRFVSNLGKGWVKVKKTFENSVDTYLKTISVFDTNKMLAFKTLYSEESYLHNDNVRKFFKYKTIEDVLGSNHAVYKMLDLITEYNKFVKTEENLKGLQDALALVNKTKSSQLTGVDKDLTAYNEEVKKFTLLIKLVERDYRAETTLKENKKYIVEYLEALK